MAGRQVGAGTKGKGGRLGVLLGSPWLLLVGAAFFWSTNMVVGRGAHELIPPIAFNFWRWLLALLILLPFTARDLLRERALILAHWRILAALALTGITVFHSLIYLGLSRSPAINGLLLFATSPLFFVLLAWLVDGERIGRAQGLGILLSLGGAGFVIAQGELSALLALRLAPGDLWLLAGVVLWALYSVLLRRRPQALAPLTLLAATVALALVLLLPLYALELASGARLQVTPVSLASLAYVALFPSVVAYVCWNRGVREAGAARAGVTLQLMPVFGALLAVAFLGERLAGYHWLGGALVMSGILLAWRQRARSG
jgi:drug/metabolite transporter (DMT)-like permease